MDRESLVKKWRFIKALGLFVALLTTILSAQTVPDTDSNDYLSRRDRFKVLVAFLPSFNGWKYSIPFCFEFFSSGLINF